MSIYYVCRYCHNLLGKIEDMSVAEERLGFQTLTAEERESIISRQENGEIYAQVVCEYCQETIEQHPELVLFSTIHH